MSNETAAIAERNPETIHGTPISGESLRELQQLQTTHPLVYQHIERRLQRPGAHVVLSIQPHLIQPSRFANRHPHSFSGPEFEELKSAIRQRGGNTQPIIVRPVQRQIEAEAAEDPEQGLALYEIVSGHRRHQACRELGCAVRAIVMPALSDHELTQAMHDENHARSNLTPWEAGCMYKQWLAEGLYTSQARLAAAIDRSPADVSRAIALVTLPEPVIQAFESPLALQYKDADELKQLLQLKQEAVLQRAQALAELPRRKSRAEVLRLLKEAALGESVGSTNAARKALLKHKEQALAQVVWDAQGRGQITLAQELQHAAQLEFEVLLTKTIARALRKPTKQAAGQTPTQPAPAKAEVAQ